MKLFFLLFVTLVSQPMFAVTTRSGTNDKTSTSNLRPTKKHTSKKHYSQKPEDYKYSDGHHKAARLAHNFRSRQKFLHKKKLYDQKQYREAFVSIMYQQTEKEIQACHPTKFLERILSTVKLMKKQEENFLTFENLKDRSPLDQEEIERLIKDVETTIILTECARRCIHNNKMLQKQRELLIALRGLIEENSNPLPLGSRLSINSLLNQESYL